MCSSDLSLCPVHFAPDVEGALAIMQAHEIAVVIGDVGGGHEETTEMIKVLKQENPGILTIVVTNASDSELVIELINQAQIFRFVNKPVNVKLLSGHIQAALTRFLQFKAAPKLMHQHKVSVSDKLRASRLGQALLTRIKSLRGLFGTRTPSG